jgi:hypothetical protein
LGARRRRWATAPSYQLVSWVIAIDDQHLHAGTQPPVGVEALLQRIRP